MEGKEYPRVLVTCIDSWRDDVGANTLPSFFSSWNSEDVAVVYTKSELPNSTYAAHYFQISENDVVHASLHPGRKCGKEVQNQDVTDTQTEDYQRSIAGISEEGKRYNFFRQHRWKFFYIARDILWGLGAWKSKDLDKFISDYHADVMFLPIYPYVYINKIQAYIARKAGVRGVAYIADDNYSYKPEWYNPVFLLQRFFLRRSIDEVMKYADELLVILPKLIDEYKDTFNIPIRVLTKGIDTDSMKYEEAERTLPLKMVYTGNLFIGRDKTVLKIVDALKRINADGPKIQLYIYSHVHLPEKLRKKLNVDGTSYFMGAVTNSEVANIQKSADMVLFVEAIDPINKNRARLSFSTKLTDYFKSGKCIFAAGNRDVAPIDYLVDNDCAVVAGDEDEIFQKLNSIANNPAILNLYGKRAFDVGIQKHSKETMDQIFYSSLVNAAHRKSDIPR